MTFGPMTSRNDIVSFLWLALAYSAFTVSTLTSGLDTGDLLARVIGFYVIVALALAVIQIVVEWAFGKQVATDRAFEREIGERSGRNAYVAVIGMAWAPAFLLVLPDGATLTIAASVALLGLGELVRYGSRIVYRGLGTGRNQRALAG